MWKTRRRPPVRRYASGISRRDGGLWRRLREKLRLRFQCPPDGYIFSNHHVVAVEENSELFAKDTRAPSFEA